ncbi:serine/threonine protein kinase, partial [Bifidobacteriaceae bacterium NR003]
MFCINCGNKIDADDKFCSSCGAPVENVEQEQQHQANQQLQYNQQQPQTQQPQTQPQPQPQVQPTQTTQPTQPTQSKQPSPNKANLLNNRKRLAIMITSIVLTIVLAITGTVWYFTRNTHVAFTVFNSKSEVIPKAKAGDDTDGVVKSLEN